MKSKTDKPIRRYVKPEVIRVEIDNLTSLAMMTVIPGDPPPRTGSTRNQDEPFQSPFGDKPFG